MIRVLVFEFRRMSFGMGFLLTGSRKMSYLCIELNLSEIDLIFQLKINHELADIVVINKF
jgi:hypothetical protein